MSNNVNTTRYISMKAYPVDVYWDEMKFLSGAIFLLKIT